MRGRSMAGPGGENLPIETFRLLQPSCLVQLQCLRDGTIEIAAPRRLPGAASSTLCAFAPSQCPVDGTPALFV